MCCVIFVCEFHRKQYFAFYTEMFQCRVLAHLDLHIFDLQSVVQSITIFEVTTLWLDHIINDHLYSPKW